MWIAKQKRKKRMKKKNFKIPSRKRKKKSFIKEFFCVLEFRVLCYLQQTPTHTIAKLSRLYFSYLAYQLSWGKSTVCSCKVLGWKNFDFTFFFFFFFFFSITGTSEWFEREIAVKFNRIFPYQFTDTGV